MGFCLLGALRLRAHSVSRHPHPQAKREWGLACSRKHKLRPQRDGRRGLAGLNSCPGFVVCTVWPAAPALSLVVLGCPGN